MDEYNRYLNRMLNRDYRKYGRAIRVRRFKNKAKQIAKTLASVRVSVSWLKPAKGGLNKTHVATLLFDDTFPVGTILLFEKGKPDNYPGEWEMITTDASLYRRVK